MNTKQLKKQLILNIPYIILGLLATNLGEAWRIAAGANASEKVQSLVLDGVFATAFSASHCRTIGLCNALLTRPQTTRHPALLRERRVVFYYGKDTYFPALGRVYGFLLWADTLLSYFGQGALFLRRGGRVFSASGKAHCFPASGGRHSFNLGGAQGLSRFGRGAFLFWGMAYCFRPRRCAFVYPCAYEGLPRLRNEAPECLLWQSGASGGCMPRRVRRLAGDAEAVGALCAPP